MSFLTNPKIISILLFCLYFIIVRNYTSKISKFNISNYISKIEFNTKIHYIVLFLYFLSLFKLLENYVYLALILLLFIILRSSNDHLYMYLIIYLYLFFTNDLISLVYYSIFLLTINQNYSLILLIIHLISLQNQCLKSLLPFFFLIEILDDIQISNNTNKNLKQNDFSFSEFFDDFKKAIFNKKFFILTILFMSPSIFNLIHFNISPIQVNIEKYFPENNTKFYDDLIPSMLNASKKDFSFDKCPHCNFEPIYKSHSTKRDLIIIEGCGNPSLAQLAIKSLRSTGCKARIFLIIAEKDKITSQLQDFFTNCGVDVFRCQIDTRNNLYFYTGMRFALNEEFLYKGKNLFDRVFYFDAFDTVFQSDPFMEQTWKQNSLYISDEQFLIGWNGFMLDWYKNMINFDPKPIHDKNTICSGIFGGYPDVIIKVGQLMHTFYIGFELIAQDQVLFDYLIYFDFLKKAGIEIIANPHFSSIAMTIHNYNKVSLGQFSNKESGFLPAVIHQYNRAGELYPLFANNCLLNNK